MAGPRLTAEDVLKINAQLTEQNSILNELETSLGNINGTVQKLDAQLFSASNAARQFLKFSTALFGDIGEQIINYSEELRRSVAGNEEFLKSLRKNRDEIFELSKTTSKFGVGAKENLQIVRALAKENIKLLPIYRDNRVALVDFTARMKAFGVETTESIGIVRSLTSNLDMNGDQLDESRRKLVSFAKQTGQGVSEVMSSYSKSINSFMDFLNPEQMNKSFMQFQVMARRMGTEANTLYDLALKFDTLESAQSTGARLNQTFSSLGIEFNSLALQEMEPEERVRYISDKTREALSRARNMGGKEGRLIMASLRDSGFFGSNEMIRAFEAEGGGRRMDPFEMGAGLQEMTRGQEASLARRLNFTRVEAAEAEERAAAAVRNTQAFRKFDAHVDDFGGSILRFSEAVAPLKDAFAEAQAKNIDKYITATADRLFNLQNQKISDEEKEYLNKAGVATENIKTISDLVRNIANIDKQKLESIFADEKFWEPLITGFLEGSKKVAQKVVRDKVKGAVQGD